MCSALKVAKRSGRTVQDLDMLDDLAIPGAIVPKRRWLTPAEFVALVGALVGALIPHRADWVRVAVWTGGRKEEVSGLLWTDVDLDAGVLHIRGTKGRRHDRNASDRYIPIGADFRAWLEARPVRSGPLVRYWHNPEPMLADRCAKLGMPVCTPHDFRRTFASWLKQRGVDSMIVAKMLGHTSSALVDQVYGQLDMAAMKRALGLP